MKTTVRLDADGTQRVLEHAIRNNAQLVLSISSHPDVTINGFLITADEKTILMEVTGKPALSPAVLEGSTVTGELFSDQRYCFTTTVRSAPNWGDSQALALDRPQEVTVLDRRRFWRARLAPSCRVSLEWVHCGSRERHEAPLLNVSSDGLACRVDKLAAAAVEVKNHLSVKFKIGGSSQYYTLEGMVMNKTPASQGGVILGIQFTRVLDSVNQLAQLRKMLNSSQTIGQGRDAEALA